MARTKWSWHQRERLAFMYDHGFKLAAIVEGMRRPGWSDWLVDRTFDARSQRHTATPASVRCQLTRLRKMRIISVESARAKGGRPPNNEGTGLSREDAI